MKDLRDLTREIAEAPVFVLTADQDWTPEWCMEVFLEEVERFGIPLHFFVTSRSDTLQDALERWNGKISLGIHPNFRSGTTQGNSVDEIIDNCLDLVPEATTFRCHCYFEDSIILEKLFQKGLRADSNLCSFFQSNLAPIVHWTGLLRFPVFFEDDVFFRFADSSLSLKRLCGSLFSPGLKIINFHPTFVACNVPSLCFYESLRVDIFRSGDCSRGLRHDGRGTMSVFRELCSEICNAGVSFTSFPDLVSDVSARIAGTFLDARTWSRKENPGGSDPRALLPESK